MYTVVCVGKVRSGVSGHPGICAEIEENSHIFTHFRIFDSVYTVVCVGKFHVCVSVQRSLCGEIQKIAKKKMYFRIFE